MIKIILLTSLSVLAFAANSILARLALAGGQMDAFSYTGVRLAAGALTLFAILQIRGGKTRRFAVAGSWVGAASLLGYGLLFSVAYVLLEAGTGALILFASVQIGMLGWAIVKGERPNGLEWLGMGVAALGFVYLVSPGLVAPHPLGSVLMAVAGLSWAAYSLIGRGSAAPLDDTAGNFMRLLPIALVLLVAGLLVAPPSGRGIALAVVSGALASGVGYAIWYTVLPALTRTRAAIVQLTVPAIAALGGVVLIAEPLGLRLVVSSITILGGVALAIHARARRAQRV